jgi:DNA-nicking Smr family endonuclease
MSRKRKGISADEEELWRRVTATATPLHGRPVAKADVPKPGPVSPPQRAEGDLFAAFVTPARPKGPGATKVSLQPAIDQTVAAHPLRMDHRTYRQMVRGKTRPEARIDLHGMTLAEAHPALIGFVLRAQNAGCRLILVITGKGKRSEDHGPIPQRLGALRHQVPHWLHSAPLSGIVQQIATAHAKHGGMGAYYVYLRRPK